MESKKIQANQESEYCFPYHYVSRMPATGFAQHFVDSWGINYISTINFLLKNIEQLQLKSLIDIGCGDGRLTREIRIRFPSIELKGIDYSQRAIALAKAMNQDLIDLEYERIDVSAYAFPKKYDIAVLMEVFEHIPIDETDAFLSGVHRALKDGGVLLLTVPHINKKVEYKHFQHFSLETISSYLSPYFYIIEAIPFERKGILRRIFNKILCNKFYVLNNTKLLMYLYELHEKYLFNCNKEEEIGRAHV